MAYKKFEKGKLGPKELGALGGKARAQNEREMKAKIFEWADFGRYIRTRGIEKAKEEMETLQGKDYISAFVSVGDFFEPKLARTENKNENKNETTVKIDPETLDTIQSAIKNL